MNLAESKRILGPRACKLMDKSFKAGINEGKWQMKRYTSKAGETRTFEGWHVWAEGFYENCESNMPSDWWERVQRTLGLVEVLV